MDFGQADFGSKTRAVGPEPGFGLEDPVESCQAGHRRGSDRCIADSDCIADLDCIADSGCIVDRDYIADPDKVGRAAVPAPLERLPALVELLPECPRPAEGKSEANFEDR